MADDIPHDGAPLEVPLPLSPYAEVEEPVIVGAGAATEDIAADLEAEFALELEPKPLLLRGDFHAYRGYGATTTRDWYDELFAGVRNIVDEAGFNLFCSGLSRLIASRPLFGALVER
ncbi:hypothetical protein ACSBR2_004098 [Camellia fascicularis]